MISTFEARSARWFHDRLMQTTVFIHTTVLSFQVSTFQHWWNIYLVAYGNLSPATSTNSSSWWYREIWFIEIYRPKSTWKDVLKLTRHKDSNQQLRHTVKMDWTKYLILASWLQTTIMCFGPAKMVGQSLRPYHHAKERRLFFRIHWSV